MGIAIESEIMCGVDGKASVRERILASPINYGPVEGEKLMGV